MINQTILAGWITNDIRLYRTESGKEYVRGAVTVQRNYKNKDTGKADTDIINFTAFNSTARFLDEWVGKGDRVVVKGRLQSSNYKIKQVIDDEGTAVEKTIYKTDLIVDEVDLVKKAEPKKEPVQEKYDYEDEDDLTVGLPF